MHFSWLLVFLFKILLEDLEKLIGYTFNKYRKAADSYWRRFAIIDLFYLRILTFRFYKRSDFRFEASIDSFETLIYQFYEFSNSLNITSVLSVISIAMPVLAYQNIFTLLFSFQNYI
jgi:hypothetical protein